MKTFWYYLMIVLTVSELLFSQEVANHTNGFDICGQNSGNITVKSVFRWGDPTPKLYLFTHQDQVIRVNDFQWNRDTKQLEFKQIELLDSNVWNTTLMMFAFSVKYPDQKDRVVKVSRRQELNSTDLLKVTVIDMDVNSGQIEAIKEMPINTFECNNSDPMKWCKLFGMFPQSNIQTNLLSITPFPTPGTANSELPLRLFLYFREINPYQAICQGCYRSYRYIMVRKVNSMDWVFETTDPQSSDLNGLIVNSSVSLTHYFRTELDISRFDWIEFSGTEYTIYRMSLTSPKVENFEKIVSGSIRALFKCIEPTTVTQPTEDTDGPQSEEPDGSETGGPDGSGTGRPDGWGTGEPDGSGTGRPDESGNGGFNTNAPNGIPVNPKTSQGLPDVKKTRPPVPESSSKKSGEFPWIWLILGIILLLIVIGVIAWFLISRRGGEEKGAKDTATPPSTSPLSGPASPPPPSEPASPPPPSGPAPPPLPSESASPPGATLEIPDDAITITPSDTPSVRSEIEPIS